jgi:hypothetical protein
MAGFLALGWVSVPASLAGELPALPEHQLKALYLFNFTRYVEWPDQAFGGTNTCYTIGIAGSQEICADLRQITNQKTIHERKIQVRQIDCADDARGCHIVYLGPRSGALAAEVLNAVSHKPVLTVGEMEDFIALGGMVHFAREDKKLRVEINLEASQQAHLSFSARLLPIARVIRGAPEPARN